MAKNQITQANVQHPPALTRILNAVVDEIDSIRALVNELRTDHATNKTSHDAMETLIEELHDDHATLKTSHDAMETLIEELHDDHATFKTVADDMKTLVNDIRAKVNGDYILVSPKLGIGGTATNVSNVAFEYLINGRGYDKAAVAAGTAPGNDVVPQSKYGAVAFDIGTDGTIDAIEAAANATGYDSAALAIAGIPAAAADHARMGWVTATKSDGDFTFGTTQLDAANTTVTYTDADTCFTAIGSAVATSTPATLTAAKPASGPATLTAAKPASGPATLTATAVTSQVDQGK